MRSTVEPVEKSPVLGPAIKPPKPAPAPVPVAPGVVRNSDGTLSTNLPAPKPYWFPTPYGLPALGAVVSGVEVVEQSLIGQAVADSFSPLEPQTYGFAPVVLTFDFSPEECQQLKEAAAFIEAELAAVPAIDLTDPYTQRLLGCI